MTTLRDLCRTLATEAGARVNIPAGVSAPHIVSITLPSIKSETMLNYLSSKNICVSAGSACSSHQRNISSSLVGFGIPEREADTTIRVSISRFNTKEDIIEFSEALREGINTLVRIK
jgi:cysteine desulfurase